MEVTRGTTRWEFCPLPARRFCTLTVDLSESPDPQATLLAAIEREVIQDAVVRLVYQLRPDQIDEIDSATLHATIAPAHSYTIHPEIVSQLARPRLPELGVGATIEPMTALKAYLANREDLKEIQADMLVAAQNLLSLDEPLTSLEARSGILSHSVQPMSTSDTQLSLL